MFMSFAKFGLVALPLVARSAFAATCTRNYTVVAGDICDSISKANNVSTYQLAAVNANTVDALCSNLEIGSTLCLGTEGEDCNQTHVIDSTDTCESIASTYNVNSTILMENNPNIDDTCSNIYEGEVLCVASEVAAPPVPSGFFSNDDDVEWVPVSPDSTTPDDDLPDCDDVM